MSTTGERASTENGARAESVPPQAHDGSRALLYLKDESGRLWVAGALLTQMTARDGSGEERTFESFAEGGLKCQEIKVIA